MEALLPHPQALLNYTCSSLNYRVPFCGPLCRVPYLFGDLKEHPNLENYPYVKLLGAGRLRLLELFGYFEPWSPDPVKRGILWEYALYS